MAVFQSAYPAIQASGQADRMPSTSWHSVRGRGKPRQGLGEGGALCVRRHEQSGRSLQQRRRIQCKLRWEHAGAGERPVAQVSPPAQIPGAPPDAWEHATPSCPEHAVQLLLSKA